MAASLSRPDPSSPASVAEATFSTVRRGYQPDEVRALLTSVAAELGRLQERERQLDAELSRVVDRQPVEVELDDETVANMLGEETLRVLHTARESASEIKIRAEENAARIVREANDEANRLRQEAEVEAARKRQDAASDAEAEVALAKQQGREMVNEARAYRELVLADLERHTTLARHQIEELVHGRDRLLQVFERARLVAVDVTSELQAIDGPDELVNLSPTTGPVPLMVPRDRGPTASRPTPVETPPDDDAAVDTTDEAAPEPERAPAEEPDEHAPASHDETDDADETGDDGAAAEIVDDEPAAAPDGESDDDGAADEIVDDEPAAAPDGESDDDGDGNVVSLFRGRQTVDTGAGDPADDVFARLRSEVPDDADQADEHVEHVEQVEDVEASEPTAFSRRDEAIVPLIVAGARKLKRVLADEQNGVLDTLRRTEPVTVLDDLLADADEHVGHYVEALTDELIGAAAAGATETGVNDTKTLRRKLGKAGALDAAHQLIGSDLVGSLRDRLTRSVAEGAGDNDDITKRVRAVYREWKTQHIDDVLDDVFRFAHGGGISAAVEPGSPLLWTIDPSEPACADCEDNSLAGPVPAGDPFPTGHASAPAHSGCRCLTLPDGQ